MTKQGTSTIVQYVREGELVVAYAVQRSWQMRPGTQDRVFATTARWLVPGGIGVMRRETTVPGLAPGPLTYGRADLIAGGVLKPAGHTFDSLPYLSLNL